MGQGKKPGWYLNWYLNDVTSEITVASHKCLVAAVEGPNSQ